MMESDVFKKEEQLIDTAIRCIVSINITRREPVQDELRRGTRETFKGLQR